MVYATPPRSFTKEQFERRFEYGHEVLSNYYEKYIDEWNKLLH
jgi:DNA helicase-2/ATP-dependent DNA helicase PcrA